MSPTAFAKQDPAVPPALHSPALHQPYAPYAPQDRTHPDDRWPSRPPSQTPSPPSSTESASGAPKKKHICSTCNKAFTTSGHLSRHARVHTGERNHRCPFPGCETRCSRQDNLQQHYRIHLSPGSRRTSSSRASLAQVLATANQSGGIKKRSKPASVTDDSADSPPSTPPALELAFVPAYADAPPLLTPPLYHRDNEKAGYDLDRPSSSPVSADSLYFDFRQAQERPHTGDGRGYSENVNGSYSPHGNYSTHTVPISPSGEVGIVRSVAQASDAYIYDAYPAAPLHGVAHAPRPSVAALRAEPVLEQPQPHFSYLPGQQYRHVASHYSQSSQISHSASPSPVSSLSLSSHGSDHSSLYHDESPRMHPSGIAYASELPSSYTAADRYPSPPPPALAGPGAPSYGRGSMGYADAPWAGAARLAHEARTPSARYVL